MLNFVSGSTISVPSSAILITLTFFSILLYFISNAAGIIIFSNDVHSIKAEGPINVTDEGISISFSDVQPLKKPSPMHVIDVGIVICVNEVQSKKE